MGQLVLLLVATAWAAVLIPPLLRSRIENRPNNSVSDFRNQLSSLQKAVPNRSVQMRTIGRSLVSSRVEAPADRPTGERRHLAAAPSMRAAMAPTAIDVRETDRAHMYEPEPRRRARGAHRERRHHGPARPRSHGDLNPRDAQKRRRANVLFLLALATGCSFFLAVATAVTAILYVFALSFLALAGYIYLLGQARQREIGAASPRHEPRSRDRWLDVA